MRQYVYSRLISRRLKRLDKQACIAFCKKRDQICSAPSLDHYKNLSHDLSRYKRVHVNESYVILFYESDDIVYFVDYAHHDEIYRKRSRKRR